ncbi:hypothetical protein R3W88_003967 [Solanum pinnatisectum]|uniref:Uncharacterized protein n=1 Tax=Solanum pinnatisectum TaxID=50273 RepID=A0AAV9MTQ8_9SOLN|nr:hypothetical protein R3W88_003967 [Solanum pinnatisectum]
MPMPNSSANMQEELKGYYFQCFYNQPVLRKQMRSSTKRVLHSLKESLLRITLVHPSVSFKIVVIESEDDLFCTRASPSLLPLLCSGLGIHRSSLGKLNASDGSFKLSGYISGPNVYMVKVYRPKLMDYRCEENLKN